MNEYIYGHVFLNSYVSHYPIEEKNLQKEIDSLKEEIDSLTQIFSNKQKELNKISKENFLNVLIKSGDSFCVGQVIKDETKNKFYCVSNINPLQIEFMENKGV